MSLQKSGPLGTLKSVSRLRKIVKVLARHGFQNLAEKLKLDKFSRESTKEEVKHLTAAERLRLAFEELGPSFVKLGQVLSSRPDLIPTEMVLEFKKLQDNVGALPFEVVEPVLQKDFGDYNKIFSSFDTQPLAAASIAQVHRAKLQDGSDVVVKLQRPGILKTIQDDINILYNLANLLESYVPESKTYNPSGIVDEFFKNLELETNFIIEANNIQRFRTNFADDPNIYIPKVYLEYTSDKILVMEELKGKRLSQANALKEYNIEPSHVVEEGLKAFFKMVFRDGFFHGDLHAGNIFVLPDKRIGLVDFGVVGRLSFNTRESVAVMLLALADEDYEQLAYEYIDLAPFQGGILADKFAHDLRNLFAPYHGLSFKNVNTGKILMESVSIASRHGLKVPTELLILFKSILTVEGMGRDIIHDFDLLKYADKFSSDIIRHKYDPKKMMKNLALTGRDSVSLITTFPRQIKQLLRRMNSPNYSSKISVQGLRQLRKSIHTSANLIFLGLVISSLILASAISLHAPKIYGLMDLPFFSVFTSIAAMALGLVAFYNYIRRS